jgi:hypothetical protein
MVILHMRYYCNICKKDITKDEFLFSIDRFDKPLCREHQKTFRMTSPEKPIQQHTEKLVRQIEQPKPEKPQEKSQVVVKETTTTTTTIGGFLKKVAVATGKGIVKGATILKDGTSKKIQIIRWKEQILRRMNFSLIKTLSHENHISTESASFNELVAKIKLYVKLDKIISFAKRNQVNIRDIIQDIDTKKSEWQIKELTEEDVEQAQSLITEIQKSIWEFKPLRKYFEEILYQDTLATHLRTKLSGREVVIERQKGSSRPDIVVDNIAIEIKGPTNQQALDSVPSKCMRYRNHFPGGLIVVLFDVQVNDYYYNEWEASLKKTYPDVIVIRKN